MSISQEELEHLEAYDVSCQKKVTLNHISKETTVEELVKALVGAMRLADTDLNGQPIQYQALHEREGRHLNDSETVGEALEAGDKLVLHPSINAGG